MKLLMLIFAMWCEGAIAQPPDPSDKFSEAFNKIFTEAANNFASLKGGLIKSNDTTKSYRCKVKLPGSSKGRIISDDTSWCKFVFNENENYAEVEGSMEKIAGKISTALGKKAIIKYVKGDLNSGFVKKAQIAFVKSNGFNDYSVYLSMEEVADPLQNKKYGLYLSIRGGKPGFYYFIRKNEPVSSSFFNTSFIKIGNQLSRKDYNVCGNVLPGFDCLVTDSAGKPMVEMDKYLQYLPNAKSEFESLVTATRAALGPGYIYNFPPAQSNVLKQAVFINKADYDVMERKSIGLYMTKTANNAYTVKMIMYYP